MSLQFACKPVQQFWMRRTTGYHSHITGTLKQASAEMMLPNAIDYDSSGQRVAGLK